MNLSRISFLDGKFTMPPRESGGSKRTCPLSCRGWHDEIRRQRIWRWKSWPGSRTLVGTSKLAIGSGELWAAGTGGIGSADVISSAPTVANWGRCCTSYSVTCSAVPDYRQGSSWEKIAGSSAAADATLLPWTLRSFQFQPFNCIPSTHQALLATLSAGNVPRRSSAESVQQSACHGARIFVDIHCFLHISSHNNRPQTASDALNNN